MTKLRKYFLPLLVIVVVRTYYVCFGLLAHTYLQKHHGTEYTGLHQSIKAFDLIFLCAYTTTCIVPSMCSGRILFVSVYLSLNTQFNHYVARTFYKNLSHCVCECGHASIYLLCVPCKYDAVAADDVDDDGDGDDAAVTETMRKHERQLQFHT